MIGERMKRARTAAGLSQRELARRAGLSAMAISKFERGQVTPTSSSLLAVARALDTPLEFFFRSRTVRLGRLDFRKRARLGKRKLASIEMDAREQLERSLELLGCFPRPPVRPFVRPAEQADRISNLDAMEHEALALRRAWDLGTDAIPELASKLEEHGILILASGIAGGQGFDGLSTRVDGFPVVVMGAGWPGDRQRFTLAHELAHLVLEGRLSGQLDLEQACNRFAGAFLAPRPSVTAELGRRRRWLEPRELYQLKHEYGLSMQAWVFRARDCGVVTPAVAASLLREFSRRRWRRVEPGHPYPAERPRLFERLLMRAVAEELIGIPRAAELAAMTIDEFRERLDLGSADVLVHR
jgi:Zn-dependent peptidase ImmA (M78 family)/DNA-binding XRE family transcriptional regulator